MKISINNITKHFTDLQIHPKETSKAVHSVTETSNYDKLSIHSDSRQIQESFFADSLAKKISLSVSTSAKDCECIKEQVQNHSYQIDAQAIAARILLLGEGF